MSPCVAAVLCAETAGPDATRALGAALAGCVHDGDLVVLTGDLGAGKTCLTQGLGAGLGIAERITSPTFTLATTYPGRLRLNHLDVYRLDDAAEAIDLDLPDLLEDGVTVIEWGERITAALPTARLTVELRFGPVAAVEVTGTGLGHASGARAGEAAGDDQRRLRFELAGPGWAGRAGELEAVLAPWVVPC